MESKKLTDLTLEELIQEEKKEKKNQMNYTFIIGILIGIAVYSVFKNGFGFLTIILFIFVLNFMAKSTRYKDIQKEIKLRKYQ